MASIRSLVKLLGRMKFQNKLRSECVKAFNRSCTAFRTVGRRGWGWMSVWQSVPDYYMTLVNAVDHEMEGSHIQLGADLCRKYKESPIVINAVEVPSW